MGADVAGVFVEMNRRGLSLGQRKRHRLHRRGEPGQVHPRSSQISTANYPAALFKSAVAFSTPARFYHRIKPHSGKGDKKIRQKPPCVLPPESFRRRAKAHRDRDPHVLQTFWIAITTRDIAMDLKRMYFSTQAARFSAKTELQKLYE